MRWCLDAWTFDDCWRVEENCKQISKTTVNIAEGIEGLCGAKYVIAQQMHCIATLTIYFNYQFLFINMAKQRHYKRSVKVQKARSAAKDASVCPSILRKGKKLQYYALKKSHIQVQCC